MRALFIIVVAAQLLFLAGETALYERKLRSGREVELDVAPADPRSLLTGHYATLQFRISQVDLSTLPERPEGPPLQAGDTVYAILNTEQSWGSPLLGLSRALPRSPVPGKVYLRGTVDHAHSNRVAITYGIERYQIPEGREQEVNTMLQGPADAAPAGAQPVMVEWRYTGVTVLVVVDGQGRGQLKRLKRYGEPLPY